MKEILSKIFPKDNVFSLISIFFFVFGLTLLVAILFTSTTRGIVVNLICAMFFIIAGIGSIFIAKNGNQ